MSKKVSQKAKEKPAASKAPARKPAVSGKLKKAARTPATSKSAAVNKTAQRKDATPAAKAKSAAKPVKPAAKSEKPSIGRKPAPSKPSRAKAIADSKKAPALGKKATAVKDAAKKITKVAAPKAPVQAAKPAVKAKPAPQPGGKASAPAAAISTIAAVKSEISAQAVIPPYKAPSEFDGFKVNDYVVYPTHGVGKIVAVEAQEIAGTRLELFVIVFEQEKMTLRVPLGKAKAVGMRILSSRETVRTALKTLRGRARIKRTMWSRRAQEYEAKINSGDLLLIAEVVRDLHRAEGQPEQSYSERQIYESALDRMAREVGAVEELDSSAALERVGIALKKAA